MSKEGLVHSLQTVLHVVAIYNIYGYHIADIGLTTLILYWHIYIQHWCVYMPKHNLLQHVLHIIATYMPETNMLAKLHICHIFEGIYGNTCPDIATLGHLHQSCDQEHCTHMAMAEWQ